MRRRRCLGCEDYHLHRFTTGPQHEPGAAFVWTADLAEGFDDDPAVPTRDVRIDELLAEVGERLYYQYDYGDNWWLAIEVEDLVDGQIPPGRARLLEVLLDTVGDGVKLIAAGYLPPAVVQTIIDELDLGDEWIGKCNREGLTVPVLQLRETARQLKLLRKYKGRLMPTKRGRNTVEPGAVGHHSRPVTPADEGETNVVTTCRFSTGCRRMGRRI